MSKGLIVITAPKVDLKLVNRFLLTLRAWYFGHGPEWDHWKILRTKDDASRILNDGDTDRPPLHTFLGTEWEGMSVSEVERMMLLKSKDFSDYPVLFVLLDQRGLQDETVIVAERRINSDESNGSGLLDLDEYNKVRVPWIETWSMWTNLNIGNMLFEEYCDGEKGRDDEGWLTYKAIHPPEHYTEYLSKRDTVIKELQKLDLA